MISRNNKLRNIVFIITGLMINTTVFAGNFLIISDTTHKYHNKISSNISTALKASGDKSDNIDTNELIDTDTSEYTSIVTIGYKSANSVFSSDNDKPVLSLLVPKLAFDQLINRNISIDKRYMYSAIYIDQPINRQARLIQYLSSQFKSVGILYGKNSYSRKYKISEALRKYNLKTKEITVLDRTELITETRFLSENSDILLAIPDKTIFNRRSIKGILLTTYRNQIPVIGYSSAYVKAGALAAVFSTPDNISNHAIEIIKKNERFNYISAQRTHPKYFDIAINKKVARSLNINVSDKNILLDKLRKSEPNDLSTISSTHKAENQ